MTTEFIIWYHHQTWKKHVSMLLFDSIDSLWERGKGFDFLIESLDSSLILLVMWKSGTQFDDGYEIGRNEIVISPGRLKGKVIFNEIRDLCPVWISNATVTQALFDGKKGDCNPFHDGFKGEDGYQRPITYYRGLMKSHNVFRLLKLKPLSNGYWIRIILKSIAQTIAIEIQAMLI